MNVLLLAVPFGWLAYFLHWDPIAVFVLVSSSVIVSITECLWHAAMIFLACNDQELGVAETAASMLGFLEFLL